MNRLSSIKDVLVSLQQNLKPDIFEMQVYRADLLDDILKATNRPTFDRMKRVQVI